MRASVWLPLLFWLLITAAGYCLERLAPWRDARYARYPRWRANLSLLILTRALGGLPFAAVYLPLSLWLHERRFGLLYLVDWPLWTKCAALWLWADFVQYWAHRLNHRVPLLWRIHSVHHTDLEVDATTTGRVHPLHSAINLPIAMCNLVLGYGFLAVPLRIGRSFFSLTSHLGVSLPPGLNRVVSRVLVTPQTHIVHHGCAADEQGSNFGSLLTIWDHLFGTFRASLDGPPESVSFGIPEQRDPSRLGFFHLLAMPFMRGHPGRAPGVGEEASTHGEEPPEAARAPAFVWAVGFVVAAAAACVVGLAGLDAQALSGDALAE